MSDPQLQARARRPRQEPPRRTTPAGFILCAQCGQPLPAGLSRQARYCSPDCKKTAHTQARRRDRALTRSGRSPGQIVLTTKQRQQVHQALADLAAFLAQHRADYEAISSSPRSPVSWESVQFVTLAGLAESLLQPLSDVLGSPSLEDHRGASPGGAIHSTVGGG